MQRPNTAFSHLVAAAALSATDTPIPDPRLAALSTFAQRMVETRGRPATEDIEDFLQAGYTERHVVEIVLAIGVKTLSNYVNHLFNTPVDDVFAGRPAGLAMNRDIVSLTTCGGDACLFLYSIGSAAIGSAAPHGGVAEPAL